MEKEVNEKKDQDVYFDDFEYDEVPEFELESYSLGVPRMRLPSLW